MNKIDHCIATSADANYFPALMALLRSLRRTNAHLPVVVFDGGLTWRQAAKVRKFAEVIARKPFVKIEGRGKFGYIGNTTLLKFEVARLDREKVLYLDVDTVVLEKLDALFSFPEGSVGVVRETNALKNIFRVQHRKMLMESIDIDWEGPGFNAGIFALRPSEWRDLQEKAEDLIERFGADIFSKSKDQQLLNVIFSGSTHYFSGRYNFSPIYDETGKCQPAIIHYLTGCKPWHYDYPPGHRYDEFRANIRVTDFPGIVFIDARRKLRQVVDRIRGLYN